MSKIDEAIKYEVESAFRTLCEAEKIKKDEKLLAEVKKYAEAQKEAIESIDDLKAKRDEVIDEEDLPEEVKEDKKAKYPNEIQDPEIANNSYIKRVNELRSEMDTPDATAVKIMGDDEDGNK